MTWSNVGDEPGRVKIPKATGISSRGSKGAVKGKLIASLGGQHAESAAERRERLRRIAREGR